MKSAVGLATGVGTGWATRLGAEPIPASTGDTPSSGLPAKRDYRAQPFRVVVAFGASITAGGEATRPELDWVSLLTDLINGAQLEPVKVFNNGIGANVISPRSSHYQETEKPSAMERYQDHVIAFHPDLVLMCGDFGINCARGGTPLAQFLEDERQIIRDIKKQTGALIVVTSLSYFTAFDRYAPFNQADEATVVRFNRGLRQLAEECDCLYADVFAAQGRASWTVDPKDGVHLNDLGHRLAANKTFEVLAQNCSCLAQKGNKLRETMKEWRPTREVQIQREWLEKRKPAKHTNPGESKQ